MIPRHFREFDSILVPEETKVPDVLKKLNDRCVGYRTEAIVPFVEKSKCSYKIFFSYIENFNLNSDDFPDLEEEVVESESFQDTIEQIRDI